MPTFYEFFAGAGCIRAGLGPHWDCLFANDFCDEKASAYATNWGSDDLHVADIRSLTTADLPGRPDLVWGSPPCQDLSRAGNGAGLAGERSGMFWPFIGLLQGLKDEGRAPALIGFENVVGLLGTNEGRDFAAVCDAFVGLGYRFGAMVIDAKLFVPQSRVRVFVVAVRNDVVLPKELIATGPSDLWHPRALRMAMAGLEPSTAQRSVWWRMPAPPPRQQCLGDVIDLEPIDVKWDSPEKTQRYLDQMSDVNLAKVEEAKKSGERRVGALFMRTRPQPDGRKIPRADVRFDDVAGCLRTTKAGGSSRQSVIIVEGEQIRTRLIGPSEARRLMGLRNGYRMPANLDSSLTLAGDGVCVDVVSYLTRHLFEPLAQAADASCPRPLRSKVGRPRKEDKKGYNITLKHRGTSREYTLARLARDFPELADRVRSGELSAHAAAIQAGFRKAPGARDQEVAE